MTDRVHYNDLKEIQRLCDDIEKLRSALRLIFSCGVQQEDMLSNKYKIVIPEYVLFEVEVLMNEAMGNMMTDANTICHDVDLLGDWLDAKGYTEEAGLCLRVLGLIHEQAEENEKLRAALKRDYGGVLDRLEEQVLEIEKLWAALTPFTNYLILESDKDHDTRPVLVKHLRAAAAAIRSDGDE